MTQSIPAVQFQNIRDPNALMQGTTKETRIYYRPAEDKNGNQIWIPTTPLPADAWHMNYYAKKGFRLYPPGQEPEGTVESAAPIKLKVTKDSISCTVDGCPFIAKTYIGLARHMRTKHDSK